MYAPSHKQLVEIGIEDEPLDWLRPIPVLRERIKEITDQFRRPILGIHVRRGDVSSTTFANKYVPDEKYINEMKKEIEREKNTSFYLASDSHEVRAKFKNIFGDRILMQPNIDVRRSDLKGMQYAVVDMFALSETDAIWRGMSTFSGVAAKIRRLKTGSLSANRRLG